MYPEVPIEEQKHLAERYCALAELKEYTIVLYSFSCLSSDVNELKLQVQNVVKNKITIYSIKEDLYLNESNYKIVLSLIKHLGKNELAEATT